MDAKAPINCNAWSSMSFSLKKYLGYFYPNETATVIRKKDDATVKVEFNWYISGRDASYVGQIDSESRRSSSRTG